MLKLRHTALIVGIEPPDISSGDPLIWQHGFNSFRFVRKIEFDISF